VNPPPASSKSLDVEHWHERVLAAGWIGHATTLLRIGGLTILTDPVWSNRIGIGLGFATAGPRRFVAPAIPLSQLPKIDLLLISHAHYDHLDRPTLARLPKDIPTIAAPKTRDLLDDLGFSRVTELPWNQSVQMSGLTIKAQEVSHWGARTFYDLHRGFNAYLLESKQHRILFGGDSAYQNFFKPIGPVDLAILGIGGYNPWIQGHANPEQVWEMAGHLRAQRVMPIHHSTFKLSHEPMEEPMERFVRAAGSEADRIVASGIGEQWSIEIPSSSVRGKI
jgi:L-ascorbate metabolism protein UlaG (beta-lactamase superfamily)